MTFIDLIEDYSKIQNMIKCIDKTDGGGDGAEDWASGYQCLLDEIQWDEEASKIVGHGNSFTGKKEFLNQYIKIPSFSLYNTDDMNKKIFKLSCKLLMNE